jgi:shikimate dehydrogenase
LAGAARIIVVNRSESRSRTLVDLRNRKTRPRPSSSFNGTLIKSDGSLHRGQRVHPDIDGRLNLDVESLRPSLIIADVIPNPPRIRLVAARKLVAAVCSTDSA